MLYELRHYDLHSGRSLDRLTRRFDEHTLRIWERLGIEPVGFWSVFVGTAPRLTYLLAWDDLAQRQARWDAFQNDPEWQQVRDADNAHASGSPVRTITNSILQPFPSSPLPRRDNQPSRLTGGVFELRTYAFDEAARLRQMADWLAARGQAHLDKHGLFLMGAWETTIGVSPRLSGMLVFENLAHRERAWAAFFTDPEWSVISDDLYPGGVPLISQTESCLMRGTEFSGWR